MIRISPEIGNEGEVMGLTRDLDGYSQMNPVNCVFTIPSREVKFSLNECTKRKTKLEKSLGSERQKFSIGKQEVRE